MIAIILMEPRTEGNVGSIARVMKNFGFSDLVLINPKCELGREAQRMASHAADVLKKAKTRDISCLKEFDYLIGTSAVYGTDYNIPRAPISAEELAFKLNEIRNKKIGIVFGREDKGLTNKEILMCDFMVNIPASQRYKTLNISHSVSIILYEIFKSKNEGVLKKRFIPISKREKEQIMKMITRILDEMEFPTKTKKDTQVKTWKRVIGKAMLTKREAYALMGFLKKLL